MNALNLDYSAVDVTSREFDFSTGYPDEWDVVQPTEPKVVLQTCPKCQGTGGIADNGSPRSDLDADSAFDANGDCAKCRGLGDIIDEGETNSWLLENYEHEELVMCSEEHGDPEELGVVEKWDEYCQESNQPMMNYLWELPGLEDSQGAADAIEDGCVSICVVRMEDHDPVDSQYHLALTGGGMDLSWHIAEAYVRAGYYPPSCIRLPKFAGMKVTPMKGKIIDACKESAQSTMEQGKFALEQLTEIEHWLEDNADGES